MNEEKKLKNYIDTVTLEQVIEKLKDNDGMTWYFDYQAQYQPCYKKVYSKEIDLILGEIKRLNNIVNKANTKIDSMFANGNEESVLDDLLELDDILKGEDK